MKNIIRLWISILCLVVAHGAGAIDAPDSIYQAKATLITQKGNRVDLDYYRGHPVMITMFYGSCPDVCPLLIIGMQNYKKRLDAPSMRNLRALVVSFDAARDTSAALRAIANMHRADVRRWSFASASENDTRKIAALLGIQYRRLENGTFDHSVLITLLDAGGRIITTTDKMNGDEKFLAALRAASTISR